MTCNPPMTSNCRFNEREREILSRGLAINIADVFLCNQDKRPLAQTCRDAPKLLRILYKAAHGLSEHATISMFSQIFQNVHTDPAGEAAKFYAKNKVRTGSPPVNIVLLDFKHRSHALNILILLPGGEGHKCVLILVSVPVCVNRCVSLWVYMYVAECQHLYC